MVKFAYIWRTCIVNAGTVNIPYMNSIGMILLAFVGKWGLFVCCPRHPVAFFPVIPSPQGSFANLYKWPYYL